MTELAPRYLSRFSCIGGSCEETCCRSWQIHVDEPHYRYLKKAMKGSRVERERFNEGHRLMPEKDRAPNRFALIVLQADQKCTYLDADKLCGLQRKYGSQALSDTCAQYPRTTYQNGERFETTGTLSCPEMARQILWHEDSLELDSASGGHDASRPPLGGIRAPRNAYEAALDVVRDYVMNLLSQRQHPVATRLFFVTYLAHRTMQTFHSQCQDLDGLDAEMRRLANPDVQAEWARHIEGVDVPAGVASLILTEVLRDRLADLPNISFRQVCADFLTGQRNAKVEGTLEVSPSALYAQHRARFATWSPEAVARLDQFFENYAKNYWLRDWYVLSPNLFVHTRRLLLRIAVLRFLIVGDPRLADGVDLDQLGAVAVDVFFKFSRAIEHSREFLDRADALLESRGFSTLAHAVHLLRI